MKFNSIFSVIFAILFFSTIAHGQTAQKPAVTATPTATLVFEIVAPSPDSFFLVQRITEIPTKDNPRPKTTETSTLFRSQAEWNAFLEKQKVKAESDTKAAKALLKDSSERIESIEKLVKLKGDGQKPN